MDFGFRFVGASMAALVLGTLALAQTAPGPATRIATTGPAATRKAVTMNVPDTGYRGVWYMNQPTKDQYAYKYSGGLGTYCAHHQPLAVYSAEAKKTFFCYGGSTPEDSQRLMHMVSYFDHATGQVPRPTILLDKETDDAHDNPVISLDDAGYVWIFSTSHGTSRPSYIHKSRKPYDVSAFELIKPTFQKDGKAVPFGNFSYMQVWHVPKEGFRGFYTHYNDPVFRTIGYITSKDGVTWSEWTRLAAIGEGHYQCSASTVKKACSTFNYHPAKKGVNFRTNLYYVETADGGKTWKSADGTELKLPLTEIKNAALVHDYAAEGLKVYLQDVVLDREDRPIILYITSKGFEPGPENGPRHWTTARWTGSKWDIRQITTTGSNYDMGSLYLEDDGAWRLMAPTELGPQPYNPGGEIAMWLSKNQGETWERLKVMTQGSERNHTFVRRPVNAHPDFYGLWADGDARKPSESRLYFGDQKGRVFELPAKMTGEMEKSRVVERK